MTSCDLQDKAKNPAEKMSWFTREAGVYCNDIAVLKERIFPLWILVNLFDTATTALIFYYGGSEANLVPAMMSFPMFTLAKWCSVVILAIILAIYNRLHLLKWFSAALTFVVLYNLYLLITR